MPMILDGDCRGHPLPPPTYIVTGVGGMFWVARLERIKHRIGWDK